MAVADVPVTGLGVAVAVAEPVNAALVAYSNDVAGEVSLPSTMPCRVALVSPTLVAASVLTVGSSGTVSSTLATLVVPSVVTVVRCSKEAPAPITVSPDFATTVFV